MNPNLEGLRLGLCSGVFRDQLAACFCECIFRSEHKPILKYGQYGSLVVSLLACWSLFGKSASDSPVS